MNCNILNIKKKIEMWFYTGCKTVTGRSDKKKLILFESLTTVVKIIWIINNLRNIIMSGNF